MKPGGSAGGADVLDDAADPIVRGVGHVQPEDVHAGLQQFGDHLGGIGGGAESGNNFRFALGAWLHHGRIVV